MDYQEHQDRQNQDLKLDRILVYIISDHDSGLQNTGVNRLQQIFSDPLFIVSPLEIPKSLVSHNSLGSQNRETYRLLYSLNEAKKKYPNNNVIIVKDTSVSTLDSKSMAQRISTAIKAGIFDVCYLCRWLDRCQLYTDRKVLDSENGNITIVRTQSPQGIQAILFSVNGRELVLGNKPMKSNKLFDLGPKNSKVASTELTNAIFKGDIEATCIVPNLIDFDIVNATSNADYIKAQGCLGVNCDNSNNTVRKLDVQMLDPNNTLDGFWLAIILLVVLAIALGAAIWNLGS